MYSILKKIILNGNYEQEDLKGKLDIFLIRDKLSNSEYQELCDLMEA